MWKREGKQMTDYKGEGGSSKEKRKRRGEYGREQGGGSRKRNEEKWSRVADLTEEKKERRKKEEIGNGWQRHKEGEERKKGGFRKSSEGEMQARVEGNKKKWSWAEVRKGEDWAGEKEETEENIWRKLRPKKKFV